jgi:hypothetical protein
MSQRLFVVIVDGSQSEPQPHHEASILARSFAMQGMRPVVKSLESVQRDDARSTAVNVGRMVVAKAEHRIAQGDFPAEQVTSAIHYLANHPRYSRYGVVQAGLESLEGQRGLSTKQIAWLIRTAAEAKAYGSRLANLAAA